MDINEIKIQFASSASGDWEALYVNGELKHQNHQIRNSDLLDALGIEIDKSAEMEYEPMMEHHGSHFPKKFSDIKPENCSYHTDKDE